MTKKEFYLRSIISMAGNPNYVNVTPIPPDEDCDEETYSRVLDKEEVFEDANALIKEAETAWPGVFDEDDAPYGTTEKLLYDLCAAVEELTSPDGKMDILNDRLLDIRNSIDAVSETITEITEDYEENEE
ncbi:MAG: hypothetical protein IKM57_06395 [Paludibacteraceae bacterium]|nr:hypothetical protein [Paludibacteraceae bacterium]